MLFLAFSEASAAELSPVMPFPEEVQKLIEKGEQQEQQEHYEEAASFFRNAAYLLHENEATKNNAKKMFIKSAFAWISAANKLFSKIEDNFFEYISLLISANEDFLRSGSLSHRVEHKKTLIRGWNNILPYVKGTEEEHLYLDNIRRTQEEPEPLQRQVAAFEEPEDTSDSETDENEVSLFIPQEEEVSLFIPPEVAARTPELVDTISTQKSEPGCWQILESFYRRIIGQPKTKSL
jgi:hypothetical protein